MKPPLCVERENGDEIPCRREHPVKRDEEHEPEKLERETRFVGEVAGEVRRCALRINTNGRSDTRFALCSYIRERD